MNATTKHPEQKENEVFLINAKVNEDWHTNAPKWIESIRYGINAYYHNTNLVVEGYRPVFAVLKNKQ
jgi:hypothetical protein